MKLLPSSSSSSASSTTSFDVNVRNCKRATAGCIAGVIRRLLCYSSLPTYPSDHIITENNSALCGNDQILKDKQMIDPPSTPGLLARLMRLETLPVANSAHSHMTPISVARSRSMNSLDYLKELEGMQGEHQRVKTSLSFREFPTFLELENEEFLIMSFENVGKTKELRSKSRKYEVGFGELKQRRKAERSKNKENRTENVVEKRMNGDQDTRKKVSIENENLIRRVYDKDSTNILRPITGSSIVKPASDAAKQLKPADHKEDCDAVKLSKKIKNHSLVKKVVPESGSKDSSPVSVFDFEEFLFDLEASISEEDSRRNDSNSRRKLSPELDKYGHPSPNTADTSIVEESEIKKSEAIDLGSRKKDAQNMKCATMLCEICRLAEGEIMRSKWRCRDMWKLEEVEEISAGFEVQILVQLLNELVDQLVF